MPILHGLRLLFGVGCGGVGGLGADNNEHGGGSSFGGLVCVNQLNCLQYSNLLHRFAFTSFAHHSFLPQLQLLCPVK